MKIYIFTTFFLAVDHIEKSARSVYNAASDCCHDDFFTAETNEKHIP